MIAYVWELAVGYDGMLNSGWVPELAQQYPAHHQRRCFEGRRKKGGGRQEENRRIEMSFTNRYKIFLPGHYIILFDQDGELPFYKSTILLWLPGWRCVFQDLHLVMPMAGMICTDRLTHRLLHKDTGTAGTQTFMLAHPDWCHIYLAVSPSS